MFTVNGFSKEYFEDARKAMDDIRLTVYTNKNQ